MYSLATRIVQIWHCYWYLCAYKGYISDPIIPSSRGSWNPVMIIGRDAASVLLSLLNVPMFFVPLSVMGTQQVVLFLKVPVGDHILYCVGDGQRHHLVGGD